MEQYSPARFKIVLDGIPVQGYAKGSFITGGRVEDSFTPSVGSLGNVARVQNLNKLGRFKVSLMQGSPSNTAFASRVQLDEQLGTKVGPFALVDLNGFTFARGEEAWIEKPADIERSDEYSNTEWSICIANLEIYPAGALL